MANAGHVEIFRQGIEVWNQWRKDNPCTKPDLSNIPLQDSRFSIVTIDSPEMERANYSYTNFENSVLHGVYAREADFSFANLSGGSLGSINLIDTDMNHANLQGASLRNALLHGANFQHADLTGCECKEADFFKADLSFARLNCSLANTLFDSVKLVGANLDGANLSLAHFRDCDLSGCSMKGANLFGVRFINCILKQADMTGSNVYGVSAWDLDLTDAIQKDLQVNATGYNATLAGLTVDSLEVAQFIYLLLKNEKIRGVIDTITSKVVLILGRFTDNRKKVLYSMKDMLEKSGYVPVIFDFKPSDSRDLTETIQSLANMSKFVIADLTDAKSIPQELSAIVPHLPSVPIQPVLLASQKEYSMYEHWKRFPWVLPEFLYQDETHLQKNFEQYVMDPVKTWHLKEASDIDLRKKIEDLERQLADLKTN